MFSLCFQVKVTFDRLALLALLDRNVTVWESGLSVFLAVLVGMLGALLMRRGFLEDALVFVFCFVVASCQYSLMKSVQPDAASPTHGHNRVVAFSRPVYFCLVAALVLLLDEAAPSLDATPHTIYGLGFSAAGLATGTRDTLLALLLAFPLIFSFGLLPQVIIARNLFFNYFLMIVLK